ncbi:MAG: hypothetical protein VYA69_15825 [Gemmatimonadota bacterium]|nr:hypothetical protein [Gemmatimonadota bacterium]
MKQLITMGLRTVTHLDSKEDFYAQIDTDAIRTVPRFPEAHLTVLSEGYALGVLSSHSIPRIQAIIAHLGWTHLYPEAHLICSDGLDRKDPANWEPWRRMYRRRGLELYAVVDIGHVLLRNLAGNSSFASVLKYHITDDPDMAIEGVTCISGLNQTVAYREVIQGGL